MLEVAAVMVELQCLKSSKLDNCPHPRHASSGKQTMTFHAFLGQSRQEILAKQRLMSTKTKMIHKFKLVQVAIIVY